MSCPRSTRFPVILLACVGLLLSACSTAPIVTVTPVPTGTPIPPPTPAMLTTTPLPVPTLAGSVATSAAGAASIPLTVSATPVPTTALTTTAPSTTASTPPPATTATNSAAPATRAATMPPTPTATRAAIQATPKPGAMGAHQLPGGTIMLPPGWDISVYAKGLGAPRFMGVRPSDGTLFVADGQGRLLVLVDGGTGADVKLFATGLNQPSSVAFYQDWVYVGETNEIVRFRAPGNALMPQGAREVVIPNLPPPTDHWTRTIAFGPDGKLYLAIGSSCNVCTESDARRAAISVYDPDGKNGRLFATGLRNAVGFTWQPGTNQMWATVNGRDNIGDDIPPDDLRTINDGTFYGWPYCYAGKTPNPEFRDVAAAKCKDVPPNARSLPAHVAALGLTFGDKLNAPQPYKDSLFIAYHGSWNRSTKVGYKVVRVPFVNGQAGQPEDFAVGWLESSGKVWGRPVGVTVGKDGALYVTDDSTGVLYRIAATGS